MGNNVTLIPKQPARHSLLTSTENVVYMPLASKNSHGIVKIGEGLNVTSDGLLSVNFNDGWFGAANNDILKLKSDVSNLETSFANFDDNVSNLDNRLTSIELGDKLIPVYQTKQDGELVTVSKTVVGGINELKNQTNINITNIDTIKNEVSGVKKDYATVKYVDDLYVKVSSGGNQSYVFETREQFIEWLDGLYLRPDSFKPELLKIGDMILIEEMGVPDYWVKSKNSPMTINDFREYEAKIEIPKINVDGVSIGKNDLDELQAIAIKNGRLIVGDTVDRSDFKGWIELKSIDQFRQLVEYGSLIVDGEIITYDENAVYVTPDLDSAEIQEQLDAISSAIDMKADRAVVDQNTIEILELQSNITELTPKVMRSLVVPMSAPLKTELVAVDDGNTQTMIDIGNFLILDNGVLDVSEEVCNKKLLFEGTLTSPNSITLPDNTSTDYDLLLVCVTAWTNSNNIMFIPTQNIIDTIDNKTFGFVRATQGGDVGETTYFHSATFNNSTQVLTLNKTGYDITNEQNNADYSIKRVYGIKLRTV